MTRLHLATLALLTAALPAPAFAGITFGPVRAQPGKSVRLVSHSETPGGTIERTVNDQTSSGTISITRDRDLVWTFRAPMADGTKRGMVKVCALTTTTKIVIGGKVEQSTEDSKLTGKLFAMSKAPNSDWKFELDGSVPYTSSANEIEELKVYLKREWFPEHEVALSDSWEFDPAWVKMIIERDLEKAQTIGTMSLRQIRHTEKLEIAMMDVSIHSTGGDFQSDGSQTTAAIELTGQVGVNLGTMLDEMLDIKGTVTTSASKPGESTRIKLPVHLTVTKSFVKDGQ